MHQVLYKAAIDPALPKGIQPFVLCEVWRGLPALKYDGVPIRTRDGNLLSALRGEGDNQYVWLPPNAANVLRVAQSQGRTPLFTVLTTRNNGRPEVFWAQNEDDEYKAIEAAKKFNQTSVCKTVEELLKTKNPKISPAAARNLKLSLNQVSLSI